MQDFITKQKNLFACLDDASKELEGTSLDQTNVEKYTEGEFRGRGSRSNSNRHSSRGQSSMVEQSSLSALRGKESIFKKPEMPLLKCLKPRRTPDYQINPHKWQKYSLADVDISDQTNKSAAFAFLKQIEDLRDAQNEQTENESNSAAAGGKIEFKKSTHIKRSINATATDEVADAQLDRPKLKGSKLVMPEYVVGEKQPKQKRKRSITKPKRTEQAEPKLKLSHLMDDDELEEG